MASQALQPYVLIGLVILMVAGLAGAMLVLAHAIGPKRHGVVKDSPYESGMPVIGDTQRRFYIRFYIVAMLFLLFDVEVVLFWPWVLAFYDAAANGAVFPLGDGLVAGKEFLLAGMGVFFLLLVFGLIYEWKRGAFEWE